MLEVALSSNCRTSVFITTTGAFPSFFPSTRVVYMASFNLKCLYYCLCFRTISYCNRPNNVQRHYHFHPQFLISHKEDSIDFASSTCPIATSSLISGSALFHYSSRCLSYAAICSLYPLFIVSYLSHFTFNYSLAINITGATSTKCINLILRAHSIGSSS